MVRFKTGDKVRLTGSQWPSAGEAYGEVEIYAVDEEGGKFRASGFEDYWYVYPEGHPQFADWGGYLVSTAAGRKTKKIEDEVLADPVNHPPHYTAYPVEVIELTEHMNFCRGNAVKYIARAGVKDPHKEIEDLEKARWYIDREIERVKRGQV